MAFHMAAFEIYVELWEMQNFQVLKGKKLNFRCSSLESNMAQFLAFVVSQDTRLESTEVLVLQGSWPVWIQELWLQT